MSPTSPSSKEDEGSAATSRDANPPTVAAFSPVPVSHASTSKQRSTVLVHQKSPLLIATPPQITRALAYSHPFLLPLAKILGLLTWTSGDSWESFLLVAGFWAIVLYGDFVMRYAGPVVVVAGLILGMYARRYSPLSTNAWTNEKQKKGHKREDSEATNLKHQKTLDEIVEALQVFTSRCNILLDPLLQLTDFLSTQRTATSATTRPALTTLFIRIVLITPAWILLSLPLVHIITTKRIALVTGTIFFTWHSRPATVSRAILWRSALIRDICSTITGLQLSARPVQSAESKPPLPPRGQPAAHQGGKANVAAAKRRLDEAGVRFTFILYENQRRWVGLGWTTSLFAYERSAWTDEHLNPAPPREEFELPRVEGGDVRWRWVAGRRWLVEGAAESDEGGVHAKSDSSDGGQGWIYYDNKWQNGRRGQDGWGRYTRRRKWYRDAELVEETNSPEMPPTADPVTSSNTSVTSSKEVSQNIEAADLPRQSLDDTASISSARSSGFRPHARRRSNAGSSSIDEETRLLPRSGGDWGVGDDVRMGLE
ncbi:MAG: peroxisome- protein [Claussenomyces sp. TS43310]|nr:MAG: peroxisome- protein [Claussenomyces sp. TS43310]